MKITINNKNAERTFTWEEMLASERGTMFKKAYESSYDPIRYIVAGGIEGVNKILWVSSYSIDDAVPSVHSHHKFIKVNEVLTVTPT